MSLASPWFMCQCSTQLKRKTNNPICYQINIIVLSIVFIRNDLQSSSGVIFMLWYVLRSCKLLKSDTILIQVLSLLKLCALFFFFFMSSRMWHMMIIFTFFGGTSSFSYACFLTLLQYFGSSIMTVGSEGSICTPQIYV